MDTFSHAFWGAALFGYRRQRLERKWFLLALFFGAFPDLASFGLLMLVRVVSGDYVPGKPDLETIPGWLFVSYNTTHSFVIAGLAIVLVYLWSKRVAFSMLAWPFHICLDFPFHRLEYFPTKIFWPLSDVVVDGISWGQPVVWLPNIAGLLLLFIWRAKKRKQLA